MKLMITFIVRLNKVSFRVEDPDGINFVAKSFEVMLSVNLHKL